jgi:23S rRNA (guanosine2251-2'-O)-methyltransferase
MSKGDGGLRGEQVEGRRAVLELLRAQRRRVRSVQLARGVDRDPVIEEIVDRAASRLETVTPERLAAIARTDVHQGVIAHAEPLASADVDALLDSPSAFLVALDGVTDPRNLGAVLRSAETAGATGVVLPRHRSVKVTPAVTKTAAGAVEYVPIATVGGIPAMLDRAKRKGVWSVGLDERSDQSLYDLTLTHEPVVLVLGAEGRGLARLTRERCDVVVHIPVHGRLASLNVAAAATLACHAIARRRTE